MRPASRRAGFVVPHILVLMLSFRRNPGWWPCAMTDHCMSSKNFAFDVQSPLHDNLPTRPESFKIPWRT